MIKKLKGKVLTIGLIVLSQNIYASLTANQGQVTITTEATLQTSGIIITYSNGHKALWTGQVQLGFGNVAPGTLPSTGITSEASVYIYRATDNFTAGDTFSVTLTPQAGSICNLKGSSGNLKSIPYSLSIQPADYGENKDIWTPGGSVLNISATNCDVSTGTWSVGGTATHLPVDLKATIAKNAIDDGTTIWLTDFYSDMATLTVVYNMHTRGGAFFNFSDEN